jgi:DNA-binding NtrC family response regulator
VSGRNSPHPAEKPLRRALVVDDEALVRWAIAETLGDRGWNVAEAADAASAMRAFGEGQQATDVVLLDLRLPDSDDLRVLTFLRQRSPQTKVILMTAYGTPAVLAEAVRLGAIVVNKPFEMEEIAALVNRVLGPSAN